MERHGVWRLYTRMERDTHLLALIYRWGKLRWTFWSLRNVVWYWGTVLEFKSDFKKVKSDRWKNGGTLATFWLYKGGRKRLLYLTVLSSTKTGLIEWTLFRRVKIIPAVRIGNARVASITDVTSQTWIGMNRVNNPFISCQNYDMNINDSTLHTVIGVLYDSQTLPIPRLLF